MLNFFRIYLFIFLFLLNLPANVFADDFFEKTKVKQVYDKEIVLPQGYKYEDGNIFDEFGKIVDINLNFAGKYSIVRHSCGAGCMYITLIDLSTGYEDLDIFSDFILSEDKSFTINGEIYITYPISTKESYGIIMKYIPDLPENPCYEQKFIFKNDKLIEFSQKNKIKCDK